MKTTFSTLLACLFGAMSLSGMTLVPPKRAELEKLVAASKVVAVASATAGPEKTRVELTEILFAVHSVAKTGDTVEVARAKPNDGAHPPITVLVFFPVFPPKGAEFTGLLVATDTVKIVKDIIAKKKTSQILEPTSSGVAHR